MTTVSTGKQNPLAAAEAADRKRKIAIQVGVAAVLVALVAAIGIGIAVKKSGSDSENTATSAAQLPATGGSVTESGAVRIGNPDAKVKVRVVADLQCPACKQFEAANGEALAEAAANGTAVIEYQIISFLDRASSTQYSSRAANASFCVAKSDPSKYQGWLQTMFAKQPAEGTAGLSNEQLVQIATEAGYTDPAVATCINDKPYNDYITQVTQQTLSSGVKSTPSVFINGELNQSDAIFTENGLASVIADAAK
ncbi:disulfide bond formation protein DsbA [Nocardia sp. MH4]|uniref:DsbA family protein n=1 Tax=Nocardia TaxID=1817 RepID=UPI001C4FDA64|nr:MULTISPECIES: thioredoxin domain-containing protein [Nocardia]MBW0275618.1 disulfide bond formation protein DsbA [Nocardia sp. MH4]